MTTVCLSGAAIGSLAAAQSWNWTSKPMAVVVRYDQVAEWTSGAPFFKPSERILDLRRPARDEIDSRIRIGALGNWDRVLVHGDTEHSYCQGNGLPHAVPVMTLGESWHRLEYLKNEPRIALAGFAGVTRKFAEQWIGQVFARAWPRRIHAIDVLDIDTCSMFPFESVSAPMKAFDQFGIVSSKERQPVNTVRVYMDSAWKLEQTLRRRWSKELASCP